MTAKSSGVLLFANNNNIIDYVKQAVFSAKRIKKFLDVPVSIVTTDVSYLHNNFDISVFDNIIEGQSSETSNSRRYSDGTLSSKVANFNNEYRFTAYELSPYENTLLIDTDVVICNNLLKECFNSNSDIMLYKDSLDLSFYRNNQEFKRISDFTVDFYWATVVFFKKTQPSHTFFNLIEHIKSEWHYYRKLYQLPNYLFRNDYAFSIAVHIMNGFQTGDFVKSIPGKLLYTLDKDLLWKINDTHLMFLIEKDKYLGEYTAITTKDQTVHVMNKFSLERIIDSYDTKN